MSRHEATCNCPPGYVLLNGKCEDIDECADRPCHSSAVCKNYPGNFVCACPDGLVGDPVNTGCRNPEECLTNSDCPDTAACINSKCKNPCNSPNACGLNAQCTVNAHHAFCKCPSNSRGDPSVECRLIECSENSDCPHSKSCLDSRCVNPCSIPNACGQNSNCVVENHVGICSCQPGTTGNPLLGCVALQYCSADNQCPSGTICRVGVCSAICTSNRECITDQLCLQGICQSTCHDNSTCADFQFCQNNVCTQEIRCRTDDDCSFNERCEVDSYGRSECKNACEGRFLCGRNAECSARNHDGECSCKQGFTDDGQGGCRRIECQRDNECGSEKFCDKNVCKLVCQGGRSCGEKAICTVENHRAVCYCQPGYSGNPYEQCNAVDYCRDSPCGPLAQCSNNKGTFHCACGNGYVGDPYNEGCRLAFECKSNADCPSSAECIQSNSESKCRDVCENVSCGPNSDCSPLNHVGFCKCLPGYGGEPADTIVGCRPLPVPCSLSNDCPANSYCNGGFCKPACVLDSECGLDEICLESQCVNPCTQPQACGMNSECLMSNHFKTCSCPAGFTGNPAVECVRSKFALLSMILYKKVHGKLKLKKLSFTVPVSCASNFDCTDGNTCRDSMCLPRCESDQVCALNEKCIGSNCMCKLN